MKNCRNCGAVIENKSRFCPQCGAKCGDKSPEYGFAEDSWETDCDPGPGPDSTYPMKWHKFLMVIMILSGILLIANGINFISGTVHSGNGYDADLVYMVYPALKSYDMIYGIVLISLGVFEFIVRSRLRQFRRNGPGSLKVLYVSSIASNVLYLLAAGSATGIDAMTTSNLTTLGISAVFLFINISYYSKRSSLFVN